MNLGRANCANPGEDYDPSRCQKKAKNPERDYQKQLIVKRVMGGDKDLMGLVAKISARLAVKPEILIMHPAELRVLRSLSDKEVRQFAAEHGWRVVRRVGGRQIEFYNDASQRPEL
jgi:hypothetical protein